MVNRFAWISDAIARAADWIGRLIPRPVRRAYDRTERALYRAGRRIGIVRPRRLRLDATLLTLFASPNYRPVPTAARRDDSSAGAVVAESPYRTFVPRQVRARPASQAAPVMTPDAGNRRQPATTAYPYALGNIRRGSLSTAEIMQEIDIAVIELLIRERVRRRPRAALRWFNVRSIYRARGRDAAFAAIRQIDAPPLAGSDRA